ESRHVQCTSACLLWAKRTSLSERVDAVRLWTIVKNGHEYVARFRCCVCPIGCDLTADAAGILGDDFAKSIALNGDLLPGGDFVIHLHKNLNNPATGREHSVNAVGDKDVCVLTGAPHRAGDNLVELEHIHGPFHEEGDHVVVQNTRSADLRCECRNAGI